MLQPLEKFRYTVNVMKFMLRRWCLTLVNYLEHENRRETTEIELNVITKLSFYSLNQIKLRWLVWCTAVLFNITPVSKVIPRCFATDYQDSNERPVKHVGTILSSLYIIESNCFREF